MFRFLLALMIFSVLSCSFQRVGGGTQSRTTGSAESSEPQGINVEAEKLFEAYKNNQNPFLRKYSDEIISLALLKAVNERDLDTLKKLTDPGLLHKAKTGEEVSFPLIIPALLRSIKMSNQPAFDVLKIWLPRNFEFSDHDNPITAAVRINLPWIDEIISRFNPALGQGKFPPLCVAYDLGFKDLWKKLDSWGVKCDGKDPKDYGLETKASKEKIIDDIIKDGLDKKLMTVDTALKYLSWDKIEKAMVDGIGIDMDELFKKSFDNNQKEIAVGAAHALIKKEDNEKLVNDYCVQSNSSAPAKYCIALLENGLVVADPDILFKLVQKVNLEVIAYLVKSKKADINKPIEKPIDSLILAGETPLHYPCYEKSGLGIVKKLIELGANVNAKDAEGRTCMSIAQTQGNQAVIDYLNSL